MVASYFRSPSCSSTARARGIIELLGYGWDEGKTLDEPLEEVDEDLRGRPEAVGWRHDTKRESHKSPPPSYASSPRNCWWCAGYGCWKFLILCEAPLH